MRILIYRRFQHTATRRWLQESSIRLQLDSVFQHTATRRWLQKHQIKPMRRKMFQHTATRRWLPSCVYWIFFSGRVSTHSHPKVAAFFIYHIFIAIFTFQHTATRRWLQSYLWRMPTICRVSTHSHPKVAAQAQAQTIKQQKVSTHSHPKVAAIRFTQTINHTLSFNTQPPEGGCLGLFLFQLSVQVSTHSHPKVAALIGICQKPPQSVSTHSHPKVAADSPEISFDNLPFQHTATRRWLRLGRDFALHEMAVSTHSHPKVAAH